MMNSAESPVAMFPVTSAFELPGMRVERSLGITFGLVVRSMGFSKAVTGGISSLRQGEVSQFTVVLEDARRHAIDRMIENARLLGANAVIAMRFDSSEIGKARAEVVAYGTAVVAAQLQTARSLPRYAQATAPCRHESGDRASANRSPESFINGLVFTLKGLTLRR
jgi:uncharacterized protein YbjQ (UPF0145 family)